MRITPKCVWNISRCLRSSSVYVSGMEANPKCNNSKYTTANPRLLRQRLHSTSSPPYVSGATTHFGFRDIPTTEKEEHVRRVFENVAESYDVMNDVMSAGVHRYWKDEFCRMTCLESITKYLRSQEGSGEFKILDVAGGTGDIAFRLLEAGNCTERAKSSGLDPISVTVCDINPHMFALESSELDQCLEVFCWTRVVHYHLSKGMPKNCNLKKIHFICTPLPLDCEMLLMLIKLCMKHIVC